MPRIYTSQSNPLDFCRWARAWDSLPVEERMPSPGVLLSFSGQCDPNYFKFYAETFSEPSADPTWHGPRIQIDRITVEE